MAQTSKPLESRKIKVDKKHIQAISLKLYSKTLIVFSGEKGYLMCGYLNLSAANKFKDVAIKVIGVATIEEALRAVVHSCSYSAKRLGIYKGQKVKNVLKIIA